MYFKHHLVALFAGPFILIFAFTTPAASAQTSSPAPVSPPLSSTAPPTITANLADPTISSQFQLGLNNGLRTLCLGPQSSIQPPDNHASAPSPSQALKLTMQHIQPSSGAGMAAESFSTVTQVTTESTAYETELLKITTVTAWIDVLSFLDAGSGMQTGTSFRGASLGVNERARANGEVLVTVTRTQIATQTAVVKEVAVTALIYVLSYPASSLTDAAITTAYSNPAPTLLRAGNGTNISQNLPNQQAASQNQAEMLQAFKDGYALGKEMENPCGPARAPALGAVGKTENVRKGLGEGVLDLVGVEPDNTGSGHRLRRQNHDVFEKRIGGSGAHGSGSGSGGRGGSAHTGSNIVGSATSCATHTTAIHNLLITALVIGFSVFGAGASTADFSGSSSAISTSMELKASDPTESLPSNSSPFVTNTLRSPTNLRLDSLTSLEKRRGAPAAAATVADLNSGATARPSSPPIRLLLVVALLFVLFTTRVTAGTTAEPGSVVVDNLAVTRHVSATVPETLRSREVDPTSTEADTAPSGMGNSDEGNKRLKGGVYVSTGARPRSTAPTRWVFWIIVLVTSLTTFGANATHVHSSIDSTAITKLAYSVDKSPTRLASPRQAPHHETKQITNKSPNPFIAARQQLSGGGYDITPVPLYDYNCGDASLGARPSIKLALLTLYFLFGCGFVSAAGSAITTRDTTDILDLENFNPTYPPSNTCTTTTSLPTFVSGPGSSDTEMDARPTKRVRFLLGKERRSSIPEERESTRIKQDLIKGGAGRSTKPKPKPKDIATRRPRSHSAPILGQHTNSILTTASIALVFAISISGCAALPSLSAPEASSAISLPTHILRSVDTGLPSSTALAHREEQGESQPDDESKRQHQQSGGTSGSAGGCYENCKSASAPKPRPRSLLWSSIPLLLMLLGCTASTTLISTEASSTINLPTHILRSVDTALPSSTALAHGGGQAKNVSDSDTDKKNRGCGPHGCPHSSSPKICSTSIIRPSLPLLFILLNYITGAAASDNVSTVEPLSTDSTQPCEDGLDPSPIGSPPNVTPVANNQQAGTLQAAQAAEGFPVTSGTPSYKRNAIARRVATGATLHNTSKATQSRLPSPLLLFGILALFFANQTSALTLGSSAMARRALPDIHARSHRPEPSAAEPEPVAVILPQKLEMSETVVTESESIFEYCVQMTDDEGMEDCYEYISVEYGLERSETVAFRSDSRLGGVQISGEEEEEGCYESMEDGVEGANPNAGHRNLAVRSTPTPVPLPTPMPVPVPDRPEDSAADRCNQMSNDGERGDCLAAVKAGPAPNTLGNSRAEQCNQISDEAARNDCLSTPASHPRNLDAADTIARREVVTGDECERLPTEEEQHDCELEANGGAAKRDQNENTPASHPRNFDRRQDGAVASAGQEDIIEFSYDDSTPVLESYTDGKMVRYDDHPATRPRNIDRRQDGAVASAGQEETIEFSYDDTPATRPRKLDRRQNVDPEYAVCANMTDQQEKEGCLEGQDDGPEGANPDAGQTETRDLGATSPTEGIARRDLQARWETASNKGAIIAISCTIVVSILVGLFFTLVKRRTRAE
ncbi:hypothetical protein G7Y79_00024g055540 [Physcia stellaris]|nr:hypothetical protein G7Y79_00024g055540 [Physcia stellaris]